MDLQSFYICDDKADRIKCLFIVFVSWGMNGRRGALVFLNEYMSTDSVTVCMHKYAYTLDGSWDWDKRLSCLYSLYIFLMALEFLIKEFWNFPFSGFVFLLFFVHKIMGIHDVDTWW